MIAGINPDNGSHFDAIFVLVVLPLVLVLYLWHRWRVKREKRRAREQRRYDFKEFVRDTPPLSSFRMPPGEVLDQGPHGSSVGFASTHEAYLLEPMEVGTPWQGAKRADDWADDPEIHAIGADLGRAIYNQEDEHADQ